MKTYLSIDLDYWCNAKTDYTMRQFVNKALSLQVPTFLVKDHHHLLPHINTHKANHLINVDFHDDICTKESATQLNCGTWGAFIKWHNKELFEWRYPHNRCWNGDGDGLCDPNDDVYSSSCCRKTGWKNVIKKYGTKNIPWNNIIAVGIAISPPWLYINRTSCYNDCRCAECQYDFKHYTAILQQLLKTSVLTKKRIFDGQIKRNLIK